MVLLRGIEGFRWPEAATFNWALDWFDADLARASAARTDGAVDRRCRPRPRDQAFVRDAVAPLQPGREFPARAGAEARRSSLLLLGNVVPLWETMLAAMKLGVVVIPATTLLTPDELQDRLDRGRARPWWRHRIRSPSSQTSAPTSSSISWSARRRREGWLPFEQSAESPEAFTPDGSTNADDPLLLYFTSGTTAKPKLVRAQPAQLSGRRLSTMYWLGLQPGDVHLEHLLAGLGQACLELLLRALECRGDGLRRQPAALRGQACSPPSAAAASPRCCAPPTVWRLFMQEELADFKVSLREVCGAGEPLNPEVIDQVAAAWGLDHPRRLRPDRDHGAGRQFAGAEGQGRLDGPAAAGLSRADHGCRRARHRGRRGVAGARRRSPGRA